MDTTAPTRARTPGGGIRLFPPSEPQITGDPNGRLPLHEGSRLRAAAHHAKRAYPGAVGEVLARELIAHAEFGYRFAADALLTRLATDVLRTPADQRVGGHDARQRTSNRKQPAEIVTPDPAQSSSGARHSARASLPAASIE